MKYSLNEFLRALDYVNNHYPGADAEFKRKMLKKALEIFDKKNMEMV